MPIFVCALPFIGQEPLSIWTLQEKKSMSRLFVIEQQRFVCNFFHLVKLGNFFAWCLALCVSVASRLRMDGYSPHQAKRTSRTFFQIEMPLFIVFFVVIEMEITRRSRRAEGKWFGEFLFVYSYCPLIREKSSSWFSKCPLSSIYILKRSCTTSEARQRERNVIWFRTPQKE